ncbi:MAG: exodeoxyribonuclease VII large subunit, partial [Balneolaceae bacterium]|nr:exodeoxyribonuclease VII large subunit [Balneolaceae bacterium]
LIVRSIKQAGIGALQEAFEKLKAKLKEEGLFDDVHKKALPRFPMRIGVITSATGAAFHDIRDTLERRWPLATVLLHHASVQGVNSAPELVKAINWFSSRENVDVLIVGRGGGSLEDLWPFNEEAVARALFQCKVPTISAVGHEVDFSISDFVADARAATPTQAAILATPDINEIRMFADDLANRLSRAAEDKVSDRKERVQQLLKSHALQAVKQKVAGSHERLNNLTERLEHKIELSYLQRREKINNLIHRLEQQNPNGPLEKGYVRVEQEEQWVRQASTFEKKKDFQLIWKDGKVHFEV